MPISESNLQTTLRGAAAGLMKAGERRAAKACTDAADQIAKLQAENAALRNMLKPHYSDWRIDEELKEVE